MSLDAALIDDIDQKLKNWNQGDVVLGDKIPLVHLADFERPITAGSRTAAAANSEPGDPLGTVIASVSGVCVVTQSCDLIRSCREHPFVKLTALQEVDESLLDQVRHGYRPRYAYVPGVANRRLVANLDCAFTVEKAIIAAIPPEDRLPGCRNDTEARELAVALSRNVSRFAFPDDFSTAMKSIQTRIVQKHGMDTRDKKGRSTNEGAILKSIREIRVSCTPSWSAPAPSLMFYFIFNDLADITEEAEKIVVSLIDRFRPTGTFGRPSFRLLTLSEMSAEAYVSSDALDLNYLSQPARGS